MNRSPNFEILKKSYSNFRVLLTTYNMRIAKQQLKQLIKEELQNVLNEGCKDEPQTYSAYLQTLTQAIQKIKAGDTKMAITLLTGMLQAMKTNP